MSYNSIFFKTAFAPNPFGFAKDGRAFSSDKYRFGFNGKEKDDELKGEGNSLDFGARVYDSRLGRFLSLDPLMKDYPMMTPYCYAANNPIRLVDIGGEGPGDPFKSADEAAIDWAQTYNDNSIRNKVEYTSAIYSYADNKTGETMYSYTIPLKGGGDNCGVPLLNKTDVTQIKIKEIHSHGEYRKSFDYSMFGGEDNKDWNNNFSEGPTDDTGYSEYYNTPLYLSSPNGSLQEYNPITKATRGIGTNGSIPSDNNDPTQLSGDYCDKGYDDNNSIMKVNKGNKTTPQTFTFTAEPVYENDKAQKEGNVSFEPANKIID